MPMPLAKVTPHQSRLPRTNCTCKTPPSGSAAWSHHRNTPNLSRNPEHDSETRPVLSAPFCVVLHIYVCRTILPNIHFHTSRKDENSCGAVVARRSYKIRQTLMAFHLVMRMPWVRTPPGISSNFCTNFCMWRGGWVGGWLRGVELAPLWRVFTKEYFYLG